MPSVNDKENKKIGKNKKAKKTKRQTKAAEEPR